MQQAILDNPELSSAVGTLILAALAALAERIRRRRARRRSKSGDGSNS